MRIPYLMLDAGDFHHMMDDWGHMMNWWGFPNFGYWFLLIWFIQFIIAVLVYRDAEKSKKNSLLWFFLVIIPWIGFILFLVYMAISNEEREIKEVMDEGQKILDVRYAKGEITREEYLQASKDIKDKKEN